jgi:hypothetical protein
MRNNTGPESGLLAKYLTNIPPFRACWCVTVRKAENRET